MELVAALSPGRHEPGALQNIDVLRNRLPGGAHAVFGGEPATQLEQRLPVSLRQLVENRAAGGISQGPEHISHTLTIGKRLLACQPTVWRRNQSLRTLLRRVAASRRRMGDDGSVSELIVVTGPPGAGKTTVSRALSGKFSRSACVAGDAFFGFIDQGYQLPWTPQAHQQNEIVVSAAAAAAGRLCAGGYTVVYDGVIGPWFVDDFVHATGVTRLHYAVLLPPEAVCLRRVESRMRHGFTDLAAARHMYVEFADSEADRRHLITDVVDATALAGHIHQLVLDGSILRHVEPRQ